MAKARAAKKRRSSRQEHAASLPALDKLLDVPSYEDVAPSPEQVAAFEAVCAAHPEAAEELVLGCVCRLDRGFPAVLTPHGPVRAEHAVQIAKESDLLKPAVGDWVALRCPQDHDRAVIEQVLPRWSDVARWRGTTRGERQTLAANVDIVLIAQAESDRGISLDRIARSATIAADSHSAWAVVLTKADRAASPEALAADIASIHEVLGPDAPVVACASLLENSATKESALAEKPISHPGDTSQPETLPGIPSAEKPLAPLAEAALGEGAAWGLEAVRELVPPRKVGMVLGQSGAGKSTLLNALLGHEALETGEVRQRDDAGRHTTVTRRMVKLPGAGVIIDCPGLRSLPLVGHERGLAQVLPQVAEAATRCKFRDCTHSHEPGCGVVEACEDGLFSAAALDVYRALADEMRQSADSLDPDVRL